MNINIHLGWWLIPAAFTALCFIKLAIYTAKRTPGGDYDFGGDIILLLILAIAASAIAWAAYFGICLLFA